MKRIHVILIIFMVFISSQLYSQTPLSDLFLGTTGANEKFIIHGRPSNNGDFLQITYDDGIGGFAWSNGFTLKRSNGYIGIGTTNPTAMLTVRGPGRFTKLDDESKIISIGFFNSGGNI